MFDPSLLFVTLFDPEGLRFWSFSVDLHWIIGVGLPVAKHETVTCESEPDAGLTDAVISDIPEKKQHENFVLTLRC